ncbi:MAG: cobyrinate a,c-diamide synthase [Desulfuromonadaceae bacterium]|nr:cobyrinate a,c-diamide synthase [Desulfuromonadaceae bacterium]MDD2855551.1 cobyrinate a,c-diamide synthase [Desulfuromonadaceae bacterium]
MTTKNGFLISAPQSGSGKTTICMAIMAAMVRRNLTVIPFKCGPDFIDPGYHKTVTGRNSINLDGWMCPQSFLAGTMRRAVAEQQDDSVVVIEGVMGLFDGIGASGKDGSTAQIAAVTGVPVVLVVNARGMAASAAAVVRGFAEFDPEVKIAGVIFNNVGSSSHAALLKSALSTYCPKLVCFGSIPREESLEIPSRHLGLVTADDNPLSAEYLCRLADIADVYLDIDKLAALSFKFNSIETTEPQPITPMNKSDIRIAVARDSAFCFMYEDNLRLLRETGAELIFFSPLHDSRLPHDINGVYLPGGYPELYGLQLDENQSMKESIRQAVSIDMPVYAECGGFVYLTEGVEASENRPSSDFVGVFPVRSRMLPRRKALGYREVMLTQKTVIGGKGTLIRGHEFHYSETGIMPNEVERCYQVSRQNVSLGSEGYRIKNCLGSYIHIHFGSNPEIANVFTAACRAGKAR